MSSKLPLRRPEPVRGNMSRCETCEQLTDAVAWAIDNDHAQVVPRMRARYEHMRDVHGIPLYEDVEPFAAAEGWLEEMRSKQRRTCDFGKVTGDKRMKEKITIEYLEQRPFTGNSPENHPASAGGSSQNKTLQLHTITTYGN